LLLTVEQAFSVANYFGVYTEIPARKIIRRLKRRAAFFFVRLEARAIRFRIDLNFLGAA
jgi:hypothetical protein